MHLFPLVFLQLVQLIKVRFDQLNLLTMFIPSIYPSGQKYIDHLIGPIPYTIVAFDISRLYIQSNTSQNTTDTLETGLLFKHDKDSSLTLIN